MDHEEWYEARRGAAAMFREGVSTGTSRFDGVDSPATRELMTRFDATGVDMTKWWAWTSPNWECPACGRTKSQIVRLNANGHLMCRLVEHHDHMKDLLEGEFEAQCKQQSSIGADERSKRFAERSAQMISAYDNTIICDDCNGADPKAKKMVGAHPSFSYSPFEIRRFVLVKNNEPHEIDASVAKQIWEENKRTFELRLKIVKRVAEIAATDEHWYQEIPVPNRAGTVKKVAKNIDANYGSLGVIYELTGSGKRNLDVDASKWRTEPKEFNVSIPTAKDIEYALKMGLSRQWDRVSDDWACPVCQRPKARTLRKSNKGKWTLRISRQWDIGAADGVHLCGDCSDAAKDIGIEACRIVGIEDEQNYARFISFEELSQVIIPLNHRRHGIKNAVLDRIMEKIALRVADSD